MRRKKCLETIHERGATSLNVHERGATSLKRASLKRWGQYELVDKTIVQKIVDALELKPDDTVLEIGQGTGVLTAPIRDKVKKVIAVEIDKRFCEMLNGIEVINTDFLKMDLSSFPPTVKVVSNLPYYITTPIITKIIDKFNLIVLTMQEEVARRLTASPGTKVYGSISVLVQFYTEPEIIGFVSRKCFRPVPEVDSCVVRFKRKEIRLNFPEDFLFKVVRAGFSSRRKMLKNTLKRFENLNNVSIDLSRRAETLSVSEFCKLASELWKRQ